MRFGRRVTIGAGTSVLVLVLTIVAATGIASAHQPVFVTEGVPADQAPLLEDGRVSFAVYGSVAAPGAEASFRVRHGDGERFTVEVLVPDRPPENERQTFDHLTVVVTDPAGRTTELRGARVLARFDEPFSKTSYLRVITSDTPAVPGVSTVTVRSQVPTRFTVATGKEERFDGKVSSYTPPPGPALQTWYETPPPDALPSPAPSTTSAPPAPTSTPSSTAASGVATTVSLAPLASAGSETASAAPEASTPSTAAIVVAIGVGVLVLAAGAVAFVITRRRA